MRVFWAYWGSLLTAISMTAPVQSISAILRSLPYGEVVMKTPSTILLAGLLAIGLHGCGGEEVPAPEATPTESATPAPTSSPTSSLPDAPKANKDAKDAPFADPVVASKPVLVPGLIPSTDPKSRTGEAVQNAGRKDPFFGEKSIPVVVTFQAAPGAGPSAVGFNSGPGGSGNPTGISPGSLRSGFGSGPVIGRGSPGIGPRTGRVAPVQPKPARNAGTMAGKPGAKPTTKSTGQPNVAARPDLPTLPSRPVQPIPTLANAVEVTGVVQIGSTMQAIVKAPDEPTSRYVGVGQRLANGQVLVKRIETAGSEPIVVLEESGIEVIRSIGQAVEGVPDKGDKPAAAALL